MNDRRLLIVLLVVGLLSCACNRSSEKDVLKIADQYGMAYAPLVIVKERAMLEEKGLSVEWVQLGNASAMREAMLSGNLDIGFMGIPPYLIGRDKKMDWDVFTGLTQARLGLVSNDESIKKIEDIESFHRIALPQPGSIQHILLSMAAEKMLGDATAFDNQLVSMNHPDGLQALRTKAGIHLQFTSPPYVSMALEEDGYQLVLDGEEAFGGPFTFIIGVASAESREQKAGQIALLQETLEQAISWMHDQPEEAVALLSTYYDLDPEEIRDYLFTEQLQFGTEVKGMETFQSFMQDAGYLDGKEE